MKKKLLNSTWFAAVVGVAVGVAVAGWAIAAGTYAQKKISEEAP